MNRSPAGLRLIAIMEASKGTIALLISLGLHELMGQNLQQLTEKLINHLHLNPASYYPGHLLQALADINNTKLMIVTVGALLYSFIRFVEAYGLWYQYRWTEWLALVSSVVYLPFELYELYQKVNLLSLLLLMLNTLVVIYLATVLNKART